MPLTDSGKAQDGLQRFSAGQTSLYGLPWDPGRASGLQEGVGCANRGSQVAPAWMTSGRAAPAAFCWSAEAIWQFAILTFDGGPF